jgi:prepilin-type N-terminal cleavage/methylation domain-containing protein
LRKLVATPLAKSAGWLSHIAPTFRVHTLVLIEWFLLGSKSMRVSRRGVSILEVMMAMVVLAIALVGSLAALQRGLTESRLGQNRQQKVMLADAALQRQRLMDKTTFFTSTIEPDSSLRFVGSVFNARPGTDITAQPVGTGVWIVDPTTSGDPNDLSQGAYFNVLPDGTITRATGIAPGTKCNVVPIGTVCREMYTHQGLPFGATDVMAAGRLPAGTNVATTWVRITRRMATTQPAEVDIIMSQVIVQ